MGDITIAAEPFFERLSSLYTSWKNDKRSPDGIFNGAESMVIITGKAEQDASIYQKNNTLHFWLLGYEFPATLIVFTLATMYIVTTEKKGAPYRYSLVALLRLIRHS
jgi:nucleosome binding factor SPN SPT16 subunit